MSNPYDRERPEETEAIEALAGRIYERRFDTIRAFRQWPHEQHEKVEVCAREARDAIQAAEVFVEICQMRRADLAREARR